MIDRCIVPGVRIYDRGFHYFIEVKFIEVVFAQLTTKEDSIFFTILAGRTMEKLGLNVIFKERPND